MTEKRFKLHIIWYNKEKTEGEAQLTDNGQPLLITDDIVGARLIKDCLNALHEENVKLQARNKYLATKIQRERNIHVKEHEKWEKEIKDENEQLRLQLNLCSDQRNEFHRGARENANRVGKLEKENEQLRKQLQNFQ